MSEVPKYTITIKSNSEKIERKDYSLKQAAKLALNKFHDKDNTKNMRDCIIETAEETNWNVSDIAKEVANWNKEESRSETEDERKKRAVESGDAWEDEGGQIRYYDDRENVA